MKTRLIIFLLLLSCIAFSQDYKKDLLEVSRQFSVLKNYALTMHYELFLDKMTSPYQQRDVKIKRLNSSLVMQQSNGMETFDNGKYQIVINNKNRVFSAVRKEN